MKKFLVLFSSMSVVLFFAASVFASSPSPDPEVVHIDEDFSGGKARIHYLSGGASSADLVILGVGTAMSRDSYDLLSGEIAEYGYVVVILDHQPGNMTKTDKNAFRNGVNTIKSNILDWLYGTGITGIKKVLVGGHSAGGQAAQGAVNMDPGLADGIFSIDPYNCNNEGTVDVPALYWGFDVTTCFVTKDDAAKAGYNKSLNKRAFFRVAKQYQWTACGYSPKYFHCSFADGDCPACTNCNYNPDYFYEDVAKSVDKFINAAFYGTWSKSNLQISATTPVTLFEGSDSP